MWIHAHLKIVLGPPKKDVHLWENYDNIVADQSQRMRSSYEIVWENLRAMFQKAT